MPLQHAGATILICRVRCDGSGPDCDEAAVRADLAGVRREALADSGYIYGDALDRACIGNQAGDLGSEHGFRASVQDDANPAPAAAIDAQDPHVPILA